MTGLRSNRPLPPKYAARTGQTGDVNHGLGRVTAIIEAGTANFVTFYQGYTDTVLSSGRGSGTSRCPCSND